MPLADMSSERHLAELTSLLKSTGMLATTKWGKSVYCHAGRNVAMHNAQDGKRVELARPEPQGWCQAMQDALDGDPAFATAMAELRPGRQREYNRHVAEAKRASTQQSCIEKISPLVLKGVGLHDRYR